MSDETTTGLPASLEMAWGLREQPKRGPRRGLSLQAVVDAGITVADSDGIGAVSMSRVAAELGVSTMALYRYVGAKDELITLMIDAAYGSRPWGPDQGASWRPALENWAWNGYLVLHEHPWIVAVPITGPPIAPGSITGMEAALACLRDTGLDPGERMSVLLLVTGYVRYQAQLDLQLETAAASGDVSSELLAGYSALLRKVADPERFPHVHEVIDAGIFDIPDDGPHQDFRFGLARILDGVEAYIGRTAGSND